MSKTCGCCEKLSPWVLSLLRVVVAVLFLCHGGQKVIGYPGGIALPKSFTPPWWAGIIELTGGTLLLIGLFTRLVSFILSGEMAVAYFYVHQPRAWWPIHNEGELAVIFCFIFFYMAFAGGGCVGLDQLRKRGAAPPPGA